MEPTEKELFDSHGWVLIKNYLNPVLAEFLYSYTKLETERALALEHRFGDNYDKNQFGEFYDSQSPGAFSKYGDLVFDTLLLTSTPDIEKYTGLQLLPTYSYHRLYVTGNDLFRHRDRPSCAVSATLCLGYDVDEGYNWRIGMQSAADGQDYECEMHPGDIVIYKGDQLDHWRGVFEGRNHAQVFLHYNDKSKGYENYLDGRIMLGLDKEDERYLRS